MTPLPSLDMHTVYLTHRSEGVTITLGRYGYGYCVNRQYPDAEKPVSHLFSTNRMGAFNLYCRLRDHAIAVARLKGERAGSANAYDDAQMVSYLNERAA